MEFGFSCAGSTVYFAPLAASFARHAVGSTFAALSHWGERPPGKGFTFVPAAVPCVPAAPAGAPESIVTSRARRTGAYFTVGAALSA